MSRGKCLILGFGSDALSDDGLPVRLVKDLKVVLSQDKFTFETSPVGGLELLGLLEGFDRAVLIDTQLTLKRKPGEIHEFTPENFEETFHLSSQHDVYFLEALQLGSEMGIHMPKEILIVAIEILENKKLSFEFSEEIREKYSLIRSEIISVILTGF